MWAGVRKGLKSSKWERRRQCKNIIRPYKLGMTMIKKVRTDAYDHLSEHHGGSRIVYQI